MAGSGVTVMTKQHEGGSTAIAHVPSDLVDVWKAAGWKVRPEPKAKAGK